MTLKLLCRGSLKECVDAVVAELEEAARLFDEEVARHEASNPQVSSSQNKLTRNDSEQALVSHGLKKRAANEK